MKNFKIVLLLILTITSCVSVKNNNTKEDNINIKSASVFNENLGDDVYMIIVDTIEKGEKVRNYYRLDYNKKRYIQEKRWKNKIKKYEFNELVYLKVDTVINGKKMIYTKINKDLEEESLYSLSKTSMQDDFIYYKQFKNGKISIYKYKEKRKIFTICYNENGKINFKSIIDYNNHKNTYPYLYEESIYFDDENKKKFYTKNYIYSELINDNGSSSSIDCVINYYNLKNNIFKKEYAKKKTIPRNDGLLIGKEAIMINNTKIIKTEYYENGKLIKTVESKTD